MDCWNPSCFLSWTQFSSPLSSAFLLLLPLVLFSLRRRLIPANTPSSAVSVSSSTPTAMLWSGMNKDVFEEIMKHLTFGDIIRCGAVCKSWRSIRPPLPSQLPWLVLAYAEKGNTNIRGFFSLSDNRSYNIELPERSPNQDCRGSSHGWLFLVEPTTISLLNPLSRKKIELPPLTSLDCVAEYDPKQVGEEFVLCHGMVNEVRSAECVCSTLIKKAVLSSDPCSEGDCIIMAILQNEGLVYCRPGESSWNVIGIGIEEFWDVACYNGRLYAITCHGRLFHIDMGPPVTLTFVIPTPSEYLNGETAYLVESARDMLLVTRARDFEEEDYKTGFFDVYRLESGNGEMRWTEVKSLADRVLFLGKNHSFSLSVSNYPGFKESSIYFTDDYDEGKWHQFLGGHDLGVYTFEDDEFELEPLPFYQPDVKYIRHSPIWMIPDQC